MRAAVIREQGGSPQVGEFEPPAPRPGAQVVDVTVAAIGPTDLMKAAGDFRPYPGVHVVNGEGVGRTHEGRRVYFGHSLVPYGACAERTLVDGREVWSIPDGVSDAQAAALGISGTGALVALEQARIQPGEAVLVLGATGVLGQIAVQIVRSMGAGLLVAAGRNASALQRILDRGQADATARLGHGDDLAALRTSAPDGFDVILDGVFGPPAEAALKTLRPHGRMLSVGRLAGATITLPLQDIGYRALYGVGTGARPPEERHAAFDRLMRLAADGAVTIDTCERSLEEAPLAWEALRGSANQKLLLRP